MKKVNLFAKKLMSLGLVASLCITSLGAKNCFAEGPQIGAAQKNSNSGSSASVNLFINNFPNSPIIQKNGKKVFNEYKIDEAKELLEKAWNVCKWAAVSGFLVYAGYKNSRDIINLGKECRDFILENKENFKEVLDGGIAAVKGMGQTIYGAVQLICMLVKFVCEHTTATKNILALVGSYNIYSYLKNKVENFCASRENKNAEFKVRAIVKRK